MATHTTEISEGTVRPPRQLQRPRGRVLGWLAAIAVGVYVLSAVFPIYTVLVGSLKTTSEVASDPLGFPSQFVWQNYVDGWNGVAVGQSMSTYFWNTLLFTASGVMIAVGGGTLAAYAISRSDGRLARFLDRYYLLLFTLPYLAVIIPLFNLTEMLGIRSDPLGIGAVYAAGWLPQAVILMRGFFASFPREAIEAAKLDGASETRIFLRVVLPMSRSAVISTFLLAFIFAWNNLSHTLALLVDPASTTVAPGLLLFTSQYSVNIGAQFAGMVISVLPLVALYLFFHRDMMESLRVGTFR